MIDEPKKKKGGGPSRTGIFNPIGWCHATLNFWWGCTKVSEACTHCYAETQSRVRSKMFFGFKVLWGQGKPRGERLEKARADALALDRKAKKKGLRYRVFVNSMSDWLDDEVAISWLAYLLETIFLCPNLDFQLLTKRPGNWRSRIEEAASYLIGERADDAAGDWCAAWRNGMAPANVWIGTTVENQEWADKRVPALLQIPAAVRFLSCEPLLGMVTLKPDWLDQLHQIIVGGESGGGARPMHPHWANWLCAQAVTAKVAFYFKQWGEWVPMDERLPHRLPEDAKLRGHRFDVHTLMFRVGKDRAGAYLDGKEYKQFPAPGCGHIAVIGAKPAAGKTTMAETMAGEVNTALESLAWQQYTPNTDHPEQVSG